LGCSDTNCFAEISGALGVDRLVQVQLGRLQTKWSVTAKLINVSDIVPSVDARLVEFVAGDEEILLLALSIIMDRLLESGKLSARQSAHRTWETGTAIVRENPEPKDSRVRCPQGRRPQTRHAVDDDAQSCAELGKLYVTERD
jgi:hypothetical protein